TNQEIDHTIGFAALGFGFVEHLLSEFGPDKVSGPTDTTQGSAPEKHGFFGLESEERVHDRHGIAAEINQVGASAHGASGGAFRAQAQCVAVNTSEQALSDITREHVAPNGQHIGKNFSGRSRGTLHNVHNTELI